MSSPLKSSSCWITGGSSVKLATDLAVENRFALCALIAWNNFQNSPVSNFCLAIKVAFGLTPLLFPPVLFPIEHWPTESSISHKPVSPKTESFKTSPDAPEWPRLHDLPSLGIHCRRSRISYKGQIL